MSELERRYRRLLAWFPRDHRERHGEEMLAVLMAGAGDRSWPARGEVVDLLWTAVRLHVRRATAADGGVNPGDVLAIVSLLAPVVLLAGATVTVHEMGWWIQAGGLLTMPWGQQTPDAPVWGMWLVVAMFALRGSQRTAAVGAWLAVAGFVLLAAGAAGQHWWTGADAGWVLLGAVAAVALTWSPGPSRGRELVGTRAVRIMAAAVGVAMAIGTIGYHLPAAQWGGLAALVAGAVAACGPRSRIGRRAALVLALPAITTGLGYMLLIATGSPLFAGLPIVETVLCYGLPLAVLLALGVLPRGPVRRLGQS